MARVLRRWGLAEREPAFQIQPRIVVVLELMMVLWADKRRLHLCRACRTLFQLWSSSRGVLPPHYRSSAILATDPSCSSGPRTRHITSSRAVDSYSFKRSGNAAIRHGLFSQRYLVKGTCQVCDDDMRPLGDAAQGGVHVRQQGWLGLTVPAYVSEGSDKTRTSVRRFYKERRVQLFFSDTNVFRALEDTKLL